MLHVKRSVVTMFIMILVGISILNVSTTQDKESLKMQNELKSILKESSNCRGKCEIFSYLRLYNTLEIKIYELDDLNIVKKISNVLGKYVEETDAPDIVLKIQREPRNIFFTWVPFVGSKPFLVLEINRLENE